MTYSPAPLLFEIIDACAQDEPDTFDVHRLLGRCHRVYPQVFAEAARRATNRVPGLVEVTGAVRVYPSYARDGRFFSWCAADDHECRAMSSALEARQVGIHHTEASPYWTAFTEAVR